MCSLSFGSHDSSDLHKAGLSAQTSSMDLSHIRWHRPCNTPPLSFLLVGLSRSLSLFLPWIFCCQQASKVSPNYRVIYQAFLATSLWGLPHPRLRVFILKLPRERVHFLSKLKKCTLSLISFTFIFLINTNVIIKKKLVENYASNVFLKNSAFLLRKLKRKALFVGEERG